MNTGSLHGKSVVVTGSGRGLGRAYAVDAARAGAAVVVNDVNGAAAEDVVRQIRGEGGRAVVSTHSVSDPAAADALIDTAVDEFGSLDGLVNNAGVLVEEPAWEATAESARTMVEVNVLGTVFCGQAAIRRMRAQGSRGAIVNVTSGTLLGQPGLAVYGATKGAVASLTYGWALDLRGTGIRVNAVSPLAVTAMKLPPYDGHAQPEDVAAVVQYLLSDASAALTGQLVRRARNQLGLIRPPSIGRMLEGEWGFESIAEAFREPLGGELEAVGLGAHRFVPGAEQNGRAAGG
jgi:NAD(P)-dependent dehydrogenase (short-subunit alcohol dehydrogenase family)